MLVSEALMGLPWVGGALYLGLEGALLFAALFRIGGLTKTVKWTGTALVAVIAGLALTLAVVHADSLATAGFWYLFGVALCMAARSAAAGYVLERPLFIGRGHGKLLSAVAVQALFLGFTALLLGLCPLPRADMWPLVVCCAVSGALECLPLNREPFRTSASSDADKADAEALRGVHAWVTYRRLTLTVAAALQTAQALACAYLILSLGAPLLCLAGAVGCGVFSFAICWFLNQPKARKTDPNKVIMAGLLLWLLGLILFLRFPKTLPVGLLSLALCAIGAGACAYVVTGLRDDMRRAAAFALGHVPERMEVILQIDLRFSALAGRMIALAGCALMIVLSAKRPADGFAPFALPALALTLAAIVLYLGFPLRQLHLQKLMRYAELQEAGIENKPLRDQLEPVVVRKSVKNYGIRAVECVLRPFFFHRVRGAENVQLDKDIPCVFVCNHGEILGPVVCTLFLPFPFRAWSAYEMLDRDTVIDRTMNGTFQNIKGWKRRLLQALMERVGAPFLTWLLQSEGCIPVYHDNPRKLMQTFRETITTMQAGDNILVFPENAATSPDHRYMEEGVSEFFTGFTMIGQMYANKTGKCPLFVPLYANGKKRLITFGAPTRYDADAPVNEEKERLCVYLRNEILKLAGMEAKQKWRIENE